MDTDVPDRHDEAISAYRKQALRKTVFVFGCLAAMIVAAGFALSVGQRSISFTDVYGYVLGHITGMTYAPGGEEWWNDYVIWNTRLPRVIIAIVAGAGLSVAGAVMQSLMHNPLADPYTAGVSSASVFGVTMAMVVGFSLTGGGQYGLVFNAFLFGLVPVVVMIFLSRRSNVGPATLILSGVAISYLFGALSTLVMTTADNETLATAYLWQIGSLKDLTWDAIPLMLGITGAGAVAMTFIAGKLNIMALGDETAKGLGMDAENCRLLCMIATSLVVASIISFTGIIGFVGLVIPHIVRTLIGADNRFVVPGSMVLGALFLLVADVVSKTLVIPDELPVGIIMSFVGAPVFLFLILRQKKAIW